MSLRILSMAIGAEVDVMASRQRARQIAGLVGFPSQDQTRIATAVSELARNVYNYAGAGRVDFSIEGETAPQLLSIRIEDRGPASPTWTWCCRAATSRRPAWAWVCWARAA